MSDLWDIEFERIDSTVDEYYTDRQELNSLLTKDIFKTFNEWKELGLCVRKGEKSFKRDYDGIALFSGLQVNNPLLMFRDKNKIINDNISLKQELNDIKNSKAYKLLHKIGLL